MYSEVSQEEALRPEDLLHQAYAQEHAILYQPDNDQREEFYSNEDLNSLKSLSVRSFKILFSSSYQDIHKLDVQLFIPYRWKEEVSWER